MKNILLIEDEPIFAGIVGDLIQDEGFKCSIVNSAIDAEKEFEKLGSEIQIVILDLMMTRSGSLVDVPPQSGETGDLLYDKIRQITPNIPVVIMTAKKAENIRLQYSSDKHTHIFYKPIDGNMITKLLNILKQL